MSNRSDAIAFLSLINQQRQVRRLDVLKEKADEASLIQRGIQHEARRQTSLELQRRNKEAQLEAIRQKVFDAKKETERLKALLESPKYAQRNLADHVAYRARSLGMRLQSEGIVVENVHEYDDKERVDALYAALGSVYRTAVASISPKRLEQMELALEYGREHWRLRRLLELETEWLRIQPIRAALAPLYQKRHQIDAERSTPKKRSFFSVGSGVDRAKQLNGESNRLRQEILKLKSQDSDITEDDLRQLRQQFGQHGLDDLKSMVEERTALIDSFQSAVEYKEVGIFNDSPGNEESSNPVLLTKGEIYVLMGDRGQKYDSLEDYAQHVPSDETHPGAIAIQAVIEHQLARGVVIVQQPEKGKLVAYSQYTPVPLSNGQFHHLLRRFHLVGAPHFTITWAKDLHTEPVSQKFHEVFEGFERQ